MKVVQTFIALISVLIICLIVKQAYLSLINTYYPYQGNTYHQSNIHQSVDTYTSTEIGKTVSPENIYAVEPVNPDFQPTPDTEEIQRTEMAIDLHRKTVSPYSGSNIENGDINFSLLRQTKLNDEPPPIFPEALMKMEGKTVKIIGFMTPYDDIQNMKTFMLMPSSLGCFFCIPPSWKEVILVKQTVEHSTYSSEAVYVEGTLSLWKDDHSDPAHGMFLFVINDATVKKYRLE